MTFSANEKINSNCALLHELLTKCPGLTHADINCHLGGDFDASGCLKHLMILELVRFEGGDGENPATWFRRTMKNEKPTDAESSEEPTEK
jgi:hypothetical protein|tara:strand:+ start:1566 stop:1835 length:270 start_codon:yes stop_codon:yes gene_type:complete